MGIFSCGSGKKDTIFNWEYDPNICYKISPPKNPSYQKVKFVFHQIINSGGSSIGLVVYCPDHGRTTLTFPEHSSGSIPFLVKLLNRVPVLDTFTCRKELLVTSVHAKAVVQYSWIILERISWSVKMNVTLHMQELNPGDLVNYLSLYIAISWNI